MNYYLQDLSDFIKASGLFDDYTMYINTYKDAPKYISLLDRSTSGIRPEQGFRERAFVLQLMNPENGKARRDVEALTNLLHNKAGKIVSEGDPVSFRYIHCLVQPQRLEFDDNRNPLWVSTWGVFYVDNTINTIYS